MSNVVDNLNEKAEKLSDIVGSTDLALAEMRLQFETMMEMQKEERLVLQKMHNEETAKLQDSHAKEIKHWKHVVIGLILTLCLVIGGVVGTVAYFLTNFDFAVADYAQSIDIGGDGNPIIYDGIHHNAD